MGEYLFSGRCRTTFNGVTLEHTKHGFLYSAAFHCVTDHWSDLVYTPNVIVFSDIFLYIIYQ